MKKVICLAELIMRGYEQIEEGWHPNECFVCSGEVHTIGLPNFPTICVFNSCGSSLGATIVTMTQARRPQNLVS